jgi:hypothetical protein
MELDLISTITSTHIQKISFDCLGAWAEFLFTSVGHDYWAQLDGSLCQLVDRPGCKLRLDLEFRFSSTKGSVGKLLFKERLPKIYQKARLTAVDVGDSTVVYCFDRDGGFGGRSDL